jgi:hypothetical protein
VKDTLFSCASNYTQDLTLPGSSRPGLPRHTPRGDVGVGVMPDAALDDFAAPPFHGYASNSTPRLRVCRSGPEGGGGHVKGWSLERHAFRGYGVGGSRARTRAGAAPAPRTASGATMIVMRGCLNAAGTFRPSTT